MPFLLRWYGQIGFDAAEKIKRDAGDFGTAFHDAAYQTIKNPSYKTRKKALKPLVENFMTWYSASGFKPLVLEPEEPYVSAKYGYQGTFDAIGTIDGKLVIADWKTSKRMDRTFGLQLAAYAQLYAEANGLDISAFDHGLVVRVDKENHKVYTERYDDMASHFEVFKACLDVYNFLNKRGKWEIEKP